MIEPTKEELALLDVIASTESPGYNVVYGGSLFDDYSRHPGRYIEITSGPNEGRKSSAAGRYQFLESTWDTISGRYGLTDFTPKSQDLGAVALAREDYARRTGRNLTMDLMSDDPALLAEIGRTLSATWTSLPSGIEEGQDVDTFVAALNGALSGSTDNQSISIAMEQAALGAGGDMTEAVTQAREAPAPGTQMAGPSQPAIERAPMRMIDMSDAMFWTSPRA